MRPSTCSLASWDGAYLWRVIEGKAEKVFVKLIRRERGYLLVEGPLRERDLIVVEGVQGLRPGQQVKTTPFKENSAKPDKRFATGAAA